MVATLVARSAMRKTRAAPVGMPPATSGEAAMDRASHRTYRGRLTTNTSIVTTGPQAVQAAVAGKKVVMAALTRMPMASQPQMLWMRSSAWARPEVHCDRLHRGRSPCCGLSLGARRRTARSVLRRPVLSRPRRELEDGKGPRKAAETRTESTPVCGVEIKKPTAAPSDAPSFLRPSPAGMTPQEHSGRGTPGRQP